VGHSQEAITETRRAFELDPISLRVRDRGLWHLFISRRYEETIEECRQVAQLEPNHPLAYSTLGLAYSRLHQPMEAIAEAERARALSDSPVVLAYLGYVYGESGKRKEAEKVLAELLEASHRRYVCPVSVASVYAVLGDKTKAIEWLEEAYKIRSD